MLSLAIGVGPNVAIFSAGYAMRGRPLPYACADRLVMLRPIAGYRWWSVDLTGGDRSERLRGLRITRSSSMFTMCR